MLNALGYYLWDIVKSAYKQIKEENENVQPAGNYMMNTGTIQSSCLNLQSDLLFRLENQITGPDFCKFKHDDCIVRRVS